MPLLVSANRLTIGLPPNVQFGMIQRNGLTYHHVLWPGRYKHPSACADIHSRTWSWTANRTHHPWRHVPLQQPLRRPGLRLRRLWRPGLWPWLWMRQLPPRLGYGSSFGGYGCGSGLSFGSSCCHRPLFFRRCGFSSFY